VQKTINVSFSINEASGSENMIADYSVRFARQLSSEFRSRAQRVLQARVSPRNLQRIERSLGAVWTADALNAGGFGIALTPVYLDTDGNARAGVDFIRAAVTRDVCK